MPIMLNSRSDRIASVCRLSEPVAKLQGARCFCEQCRSVSAKGHKPRRRSGPQPHPKWPHSIGKRTPIREAARIRLLCSEILVQHNAPSRRNSASTYLRICDKSKNNPSGGPTAFRPAARFEAGAYP